MDSEAELRKLMLTDAKVYRVRNQIAEHDPQAKPKARAKVVAVKSDDHPTEEPHQ
jgi:hypothetical protein